MKILFLSPFVPWPLIDGGRTRVYQLMRAAAAEHEVHLLALVEEQDDPSAAEPLRAAGMEVELVTHRRSFARAATTALLRGRSVYRQMFASERFAAALRTRLAQNEYDIVQCEYAYMAQYAVAATGVSWVLDEHNVEYRLSQSLAARRPRSDVLYRLYAAREWRLRRREELLACGIMDRVLAVSEEDARALRREVPDAVIEVIPNGVDTCSFVPSHHVPTPGAEVVFIGDMAYRPNSDGVLWFCREVWPRIRAELPAVRLGVVGRPSREVRNLDGLHGIGIVGRVSNVLPYMQAAKVLVVPLHSGSGTRFKVLEALAAGGAVVSTTVGYEGLEVTPGRELLNGDTPESFATATVALLRQPELRATLGAAGRRLVEGRYSWVRIARELASVYDSIAGSSGRESAERRNASTPA